MVIRRMRGIRLWVASLAFRYRRFVCLFSAPRRASSSTFQKRTSRHFQKIILVGFASAILSGCATIQCDYTEIRTDKFVVTVVSSDSKLTSVVTSGGALASEIAAPGIGPILFNGVRGLLSGAPTPEQRRQIEANATKIAEQYVRENPGRFCNQCRNGEPCPANLVFSSHAITLTAVDTRGVLLAPDASNWSVTLYFTFNGEIRCGACTDPECAPPASNAPSVSPPSQTNLCASDTGTTMFVLGNEVFSQEELAILVGEEEPNGRR